MKILLTTILILFSVFNYGQVDSTDHIGKELQDCLDSSENYSTKRMTDCVNTATEKWDAELNKAYKELLDLLMAEQKEKLKISQREWIEFRDKEIEFSNQLYYDLEGTMWIPVAAQTKLDLTKKRTIELESFISVLTLNK
ncbi:lysozyme inhibitor LprI family protein [Salinimicrobium gaetbulicola]|uniref:Lysozyme inhibitor LprI family protein n=1 Tax=Salinimicrobium gaetbulicola TaxID=999702 RepID=A0ABW3IFG3_9FLAO